MSFSLSLKKMSFRILQGPIKLLVKATVLPDDPVKEFDIDIAKPIHYVICNYSATDLNVLHRYCLKSGLPSPLSAENDCGYIFVRKKRRFWNSTSNYSRHQPRLAKLLEDQQNNPEDKPQLLPVTISWGRNPGKEKSLFRIMLSNTLGSIGYLHKAVIVLALGSHTFITFGKPLLLDSIIEEAGSKDHMTLKLTRMLRLYFHNQKTASLGPNVYSRRTLIKQLIARTEVQEVIERESKKKKISNQAAAKLAKKYAKEITGNYSYFVMRTLETILGWVLNRIYDGVKVSNAERIRGVARDYELLYVPCHRSHMDYLLVSYVLYNQGLVPPHIASGINLNFWPIGPILRRAGAFFLRRSFSGNKLYAAVFHEYLNVLFNKGYSVEYFPEGGRSRTGRLLQPKTGMLSMTIENVLRGRKKPLLLIPVYIGYDKIMEGNSYLGELRGTGKKNESIGQLLGARKKLKQSYGQVYVNFGDPVCIETWLDENQKDWRVSLDNIEERPKWFTPKVKQLANDLMKGINAAAAVSPVTLIALVLLSTPRYAIDKSELLKQIGLYLQLLREVPYSPDLAIPEGDEEDILEAAVKLNAVQIAKQAMGDIVFFSEDTAVLMTYYRNNIVHLFVLPSLVVSCFRYERSLELKNLKDKCLMLYPYLRNELFLHWNEEEFNEALAQCVEFMISKKLLIEKANMLWRPEESSSEIRRFMLLSECMQNMLKRFAIVLTLLGRRTEMTTQFTRRDLENSSQKLAERVAILYDINAPESFDNKIFASLIAILREQGAIITNKDGSLHIGNEIKGLHQTIISMLPFSVQQQLQQVIKEA
ncbi:MAG: glycerol-3-phosphate 1-O-acyltransferase PlsB [Gammaproteobacteria bacterium]|nr:glycerol-3-phosphate 1-O-acyltransferase PlsB [Gammaproteobacteria bacterium]